jgi:hypothetical protein
MSSPHYPPSAAVKPVPSSPTLPSSSNSPSPTQKADQIAYRIFVKLVNVVADARISPYSTFTSQSSSPHDTEDAFALDSPGGPAGSSSGRNERAGRKDSKNDKWVRLGFSAFQPDARRKPASPGACHALPPVLAPGAPGYCFMIVALPNTLRSLCSPSFISLAELAIANADLVPSLLV